jgi:hypothetical protein
MIPLYGFLEGDTIGLLVLARPEDTMWMLAEKLQAAAAVRVPARDRVGVVVRQRILEPQLTVAVVGLTALDRFDVVPLERSHDLV